MMTEQQAKSTRNSEAWAWVVNELDHRIAASMSNLMNCESSGLVRLQQRIKLLEEMKQLPDSVIQREEVSASG